MQFSTKAEQLMVERKGDPDHSGFRKNKRGLMQKTIPMEICIRGKDGIHSLGKGYICYADQDPNGREPESQLIRSNIWKQMDVGKLWAMFKEKVFLLASVDPSGVKPLNGGFITEDGKVIIDDK